MARKKAKVPDAVAASVPLSSMIDVVFLLLIYFIFTQKPVVEDIHLQLDLPSPGRASASDSEPPPILRIDVYKLLQDNDEEITKKINDIQADQSIDPRLKPKLINKAREAEKIYYHVNTTGDGTGTPMVFSDLAKYLKVVAESSPDTTIVMNCGPNAKHKKLVRVLDLCDQLKLRHINLLNAADVTFKPDPPEKRNN